MVINSSTACLINLPVTRTIEVQALGTREQFELIRTYFQRDPLDPSVTLGNGDDAAVVSQHSFRDGGLR